MSLVRGLLHLEGVAIFTAATWAYFALLDGWWVTFLALLLVPDVSMIGYLRDARLGVWTYNLVHNEAFPVVLLVVGFAVASQLWLGSGLVLAAHIGMDRALGYGLKYASGFRATHLQRL